MKLTEILLWLAGCLSLAGVALAAEVPAHREVGRTEPLTLAFDLEAGDLLHVSVEAVDVDITLELFDPGGMSVETVDDRPTSEGFEELRFLVPQSGRSGAYRVEIASRWGEPGRVRIEARDSHPATEHERRQADAVALYRDAKELSTREDADLEEAVRLFRRVRGELDEVGLRKRAVRAAIRESVFLSRLGRTDESEALLERTLTAARDRGEPWAEVLALNSLGIRRYQVGDLHGAVARLEEAVRVLDGVDDRLEVSKIHSNLGLFLSFAGRHREALEHYRLGGETAAEIGWLDGEASAWFNRSIAHLGVRDYRGAFESLRRADELFARVGKPADQGRMRMNEGVHLLALGEPERAAERFRQALAVLPSDAVVERARAIHNLGQVAFRLGDLPGAREDTERSLATIQGRDEPKLEGTALVVLSEIDLAQGRIGEARFHARRAVELSRSSGVGLVLPSALVALGEATRRSGDLEAAARTLSEALETGKRAHDLEAVASARLARARLERQQGDLRQALAELHAGIEAIEAVRDRVSTLELQATLLSRFRKLFDLAIEVRHELDLAEPRSGHAAAAFELAEQARARSLLDSLPILSWRTDEASTRLRELGVELVEARDALATLEAASGSTDTELREASRRLDLAIAAHGSARRAWIESHPHERGRLERSSATLDEAQEALGASELLLEYHVGEDSAFLFVVGRERFELVPLGSTETLRREIQALSELLVRPSTRGVEMYRAAARQVYRRAVAPAGIDAEESGPPPTRLYISADGPLRNVPFAALVHSPGGSRYEDLAYLGNDYVLSYLPSTAVGRELRDRSLSSPRSRTSLIAFGDPSRGGVSEAPGGTVVRSAQPERLAPLPAARAEVRELARLVRPSRAWVGEEATEARFRSLVDDPPRRLHLATHASVDRWRPELSWVWLRAGAEHDGRLEAWEIASLSLPVEQVVLAACDSALGRPVAGEGLMGLVQAFFDAGARSVVASLWPVADGGTGRFMVDFYRGLEESDSATALAAAGRAQLARGGLSAHPYYWASFVLSGWEGEPGETRSR